MDKFVIRGLNKLSGRISVSGSKNAALPIISAALLTEDDVILSNIPHLKDINTMIKLLEDLGCSCIEKNNNLHINCKDVKSTVAKYELVKTMRASVLVLGPLSSRFGKATVSMPGGCAIGVRPVNLHINALKSMGADVAIKKGYVVVKSERLKASEIYFDIPTVTGTENVIMMAVLADGETVINNAAKEPEIVDLVNMLLKMGADIEGAGGSVIKVRGVEKLHGCEYRVMNDRIEAGTFMCVALSTKSSFEIDNVPINAMDAIFEKFKESGGTIQILSDKLISVSADTVKPVNITTSVYPGFPTDMQAQFMAALSLSNGTSVINETIFENRFQHVAELNRMNADIIVSGNEAVVKGVKNLYGAKVMATDLRASASLVVAALAACGTSEIRRIYHLDRGYERLEYKLSKIGADIRRVKQ